MKKLISLTTLTVCGFAFEFDLKPIKVSENSYYFEGKKEYFSPANGGDISNSAFIITKDSVILIDTGSTVEYAKQLKEKIKTITNKPIKYVINTHHHPDHFLGNYVFKDEDIYGTTYTLNEIKSHGELYVSNMANLIEDTAYTTKSLSPNKVLKEGTLKLNNYELEVYLYDGHTKSDVVIFDKNTKTLYTSDLIFNQRALATPHADLQKWIKTLEKLKKFDFKTLVPGHGAVAYSKNVIDENINYLTFLDNRLKNSVEEGLDTFEILSLDVPNEFKNYSLFTQEYERSIINLYPSYEKKF